MSPSEPLQISDSEFASRAPDLPVDRKSAKARGNRGAGSSRGRASKDANVMAPQQTADGQPGAPGPEEYVNRSWVSQMPFTDLQRLLSRVEALGLAVRVVTAVLHQIGLRCVESCCGSVQFCPAHEL